MIEDQQNADLGPIGLQNPFLSQKEFLQNIFNKNKSPQSRSKMHRGGGNDFGMSTMQSRVDQSGSKKIQFSKRDSAVESSKILQVLSETMYKSLHYLPRLSKAIQRRHY